MSSNYCEAWGGRGFFLITLLNILAMVNDSRHSSSLSKHNLDLDRVRDSRFTDLFVQRSQRATTVRPTAGTSQGNSPEI